MPSYLDVADRIWPVLNQVMKGHVAVYRATGGRIGRKVPGMPPMLLLEHVGAKSGKHRVTPLVYMPDGDDLIVVASKGGFPKDPAWMHNLRANPDVDIQVGSEKRRVHARQATPEEEQRLWPKAGAYNKPWADYRKRTDRRIPIVILSRRAK